MTLYLVHFTFSVCALSFLGKVLKKTIYIVLLRTYIQNVKYSSRVILRILCMSVMNPLLEGYIRPLLRLIGAYDISERRNTNFECIPNIFYFESTPEYFIYILKKTLSLVFSEIIVTTLLLQFQQ